MAAKIARRTCIECGSELFGRSDQKFCCADCKNTYNNKLNRDASKFMRNINNILRKNRRILTKLSPSGTTKVTKTQLLDEGFRFSYFTNEYITKAGKVYRFCYEYGYLELEPQLFAIVIRKEYVE